MEYKCRRKPYVITEEEVEEFKVFIDSLGMRLTHVAKGIGISRALLNQHLNNRKSISLEDLHKGLIIYVENVKAKSLSKLNNLK